jgi:outer membrane protein
MASTGGVSMSNVTFDPKTGKQVNFTDVNKPKVTNTGVNSVAIGANSVANRANTVSVGSAGNERIIANVADGVAPTDAANMRQLQSVANMVGEVKKDAMAGTASAMAIGNLPQATIPGKGMMAIGAGYYKGQTATALGVSKMSENGRWVFKASASYDSQRNVGAAGAVGFHF